MDWAGVDMVHLSLTLSFLLRLLPTTSTERYHIRSATDGAPPSVFKDISTSDRLSAFVPVTTDIVCTLVRDATNKYSINDPMPTWLLKTCIELLALYAVQHFGVIWHCSTCRCHLALFNMSLSSDIVPTNYKSAYSIPRLKKPTLPCGDLASYRPISNLPFLSKLLERV